MKNITILITCLLIFSFHFNIAQNFAPIGAEWHYEKRYVSDGSIDFVKLTAIKDTVILGETCSEIEYYSGFQCTVAPSKYLLTKNDTVFFYDQAFNEFQILFINNVQVADNWIIKRIDNGVIDTVFVIVDSVSSIVINGATLDVSYVTYNDYSPDFPKYGYGKIIERIGDVGYMFHWPSPYFGVCDLDFPTGLRCYQDSVLGFYDTGLADSCEYEYDWGIGIADNISASQINISPNPSKGVFHIESNYESELQVEIYSVLGKLISRKTINTSLDIDISNQESGIYLLKIYNSKDVFLIKKILID